MRDPAMKYSSEKDLHDPMPATVERSCAGDRGLKKCVTGRTAESGRRTGKRSRPDVTVVAHRGLVGGRGEDVGEV